MVFVSRFSILVVLSARAINIQGWTGVDWFGFVDVRPLRRWVFRMLRRGRTCIRGMLFRRGRWSSLIFGIVLPSVFALFDVY